MTNDTLTKDSAAKDTPHQPAPRRRNRSNLSEAAKEAVRKNGAKGGRPPSGKVTRQYKVRPALAGWLDSIGEEEVINILERACSEAMVV